MTDTTIQMSKRTMALSVRAVRETRGVWEVAFEGGIWTTIYPEDLPRKPRPGDVIRVALPRAVEYVTEEPTP